MRAVVLDGAAGWTFWDHRGFAADRDVPWSLPELLARVADRFEKEGVVLLDGDASRMLGLPDRELDAEGPRDQTERFNHPVTGELLAAGWETAGVGGRWVKVWRRGRPKVQINLGQLDLMDGGDYFPLLDRSYLAMTGRLARFHEETGKAWYGSPGQIGNELLKAISPHGNNEPAWKPRGGPDCDPIEWAYRRADWERPQPELLPYEHGYDRIRSYLSAMTVAKVARLGLRHTPNIKFDRRLSGWWLVKFGPYHWGHLLPDPAGYGEPDERGGRWVTTPTLELVAELAERYPEVHGGFEILDAWTSKADEKVLKPFAELVRDKYATFAAEQGPADEFGDAEALTWAMKEIYKQAYGMWRSPLSTIQRPDWAAAVMATSRVTVWRRMWTIGRQFQWWPLRVDTDNIWYGSAEPTAVAGAAGRFDLIRSGRERQPLGADVLGGYRPGCKCCDPRQAA